MPALDHAQRHWVDVPTARNDFVINLGDLMAMWTNDRWVSALLSKIGKANAMRRAAEAAKVPVTQ